MSCAPFIPTRRGECAEAVQVMVATAGCAHIVRLHEVFFSGEYAQCVVDSAIAGDLMGRLTSKASHDCTPTEASRPRSSHPFALFPGCERGAFL